MHKTIIRRLIIMIPQMVVLSVLIFLLAQIMPGDALRGLITPTTPQAQIDHLRLMHGLDDPWYVQYARWVRGIVLHGDFGQSITHTRPVEMVVAGRIMNTVRLSALTAVFTYMIALPLGLIAGRRHGRAIDKAVLIYTFIALSMPTVVLSLVNLLVFGFWLDLAPVTGSVDIHAAAAGGMEAAISRIHHLILPALTLALLSTMGIIYYLRSEIIDTSDSDFVLFARAKGVPENHIYSRHILRSSFLPVAGGMGGIIVGLFSGSVFIEHVFSYPGMGQLFVSSLTGRDFPVANALIMFFGLLAVISMLASDIIISIVDPRIRIK